MKTLLFVALAAVLAATPAQADQSVTASHFELGLKTYPDSRYPAGENTYIIEDKGDTRADASLVLRDQGNARAEIGIVEDNDLHIKTVTGAYGSEKFTDRLLIRAEGGEVDSFGTLLRQYATSGQPTIVAGNSDLKTGAGLELSYDQDKKQGGISSIEHGDGYRPLIIRASGVTAPAVISGGTTFTVSGCAAGTTVGGAAAGTFKAGTSGKCAAVITPGGGTKAPHGWSCSAANLTTPDALIHQTASTMATATLAGKTAAGDVISFYCMGY